MPRVVRLLSWLTVGVLGALGCTETPKRAAIVPPKEEFHIPPDDLFRGPVKYPDGVLNNVKPRRPKDNDKFEPPAGFNGGGMGMGGAGMGGPGSLGP